MKDWDFITEYKKTYIFYTSCLTLNASLRSENEAHSHHDGMEIYQFIDGDLFFSFEGERIEIIPGDIVIIASGTLHRPIIKSQCRYFRKRILISNDFFTTLPFGALEIQYLLSELKIIKLSAKILNESGLGKLFEDIEENLKGSTPYSEFCATVNLCSFLINAEKLSENNSILQNRRAISKSHSLIKYIDENLSDKLDYKTLAKKLHVSEKNLYKIFKNETGFTLSKYVKERRIIKAKSLLNSGADPFMVAIDVGFSDYSVFYRSFLSVVGMSPSRYLKEIKLKEKA